MKKVVKKTLSDKDEIIATIDKLAQITMEGFARFEQELKTKSSRADILELHDRFASKQEVGQLSLRVSTLEEKAKK
jgi:hypothetical protein